MIEKKTKRFGDYILRAWLVGQHLAQFEVIRPIAFEHYEPGGKRVEQVWYHLRGAPNGMTWTEDIDQASTEAHGEVKWDSCTNLIVQEDDDTTAHTCSLDDFRGLLEAIAEARAFAAAMLGPSTPVNEEYATDKRAAALAELREAWIDMPCEGVVPQGWGDCIQRLVNAVSVIIDPDRTLREDPEVKRRGSLAGYRQRIAYARDQAEFARKAGLADAETHWAVQADKLTADCRADHGVDP